MKKPIFNTIDTKKLVSLTMGIAVVYFTFLIGGVLHQYILKQKYIDRFNGRRNYFNEAAGLIAVEKAIIWIFGLIYNNSQIPKQNIKKLPIKNSLFCGLTVFLSSITTNYAMILVSYPIVVMFKSCNLLSVILVGVMCSRVTDKSLRLGNKKIIVALLVTIGIFIFKIFDPQAKVGSDKKVQIAGLIFLLISLVADGFLPDFQAEIKERYNPQPTVMMVEINKWCFFVSLTYLVVSGHLINFVDFSWRHPLFAYHAVLMAILSFFGQIFIYKMIKEFKQHIVPFVITTRKIVSVGISMIYFRHPTNTMQIIGIFIVLATTLYEFINEVLKPSQKQVKKYAQNLSSGEQQQEAKELKHDQKDSQATKPESETEIFHPDFDPKQKQYQIQPQLHQQM